MNFITMLIMLWFDVGIKRYTTYSKFKKDVLELWFDVGIKRYTTVQIKYTLFHSCGLM